MSDSGTPIGVDGARASAGAQLRAAREKRGLHIAALAASMKVPQRKLEALEADRYDELPDMTFTRALAQSVCRTLKVDAQPVLERLPEAGGMPRLAQVSGGLNAPFRERPGRDEPSEWTWLRRPAFWATLVVLAGAAALAFLPERLLRLPRTGAAPVAEVSSPVVATPAAEAASAAVAPTESAASASAAAVATVSMSPAPASAAVTSGPGLLTLRTTAPSWVDVQDANGQSLLSRSLQPGETVGVDGALPLRVTVGNAAATQVSFRGQPVDLSLNTRDNVARLQLN
jgi:cytoskeleton protein RodZ